MTHHPFQPGLWLLAFSAIRVMSFQQGFYSTVGSLAFSKVRFCKFSFVALQPFPFKYSRNINLVNSQFFGIFCQADLIIVHCRIDRLLPLPLVEIHCRESACKLFLLGPLSSPSSEEPCKSWIIWPLPTV